MTGSRRLRVDALIGDRFEPVMATDETRALGETGLVKMAFSVEPIQAELFGRTRAWLRLTPSGGDEDWKPALGGAYLNAVWAQAAETMTRELLGSSEGGPRLTVAVARPPVVRDSLELRIREPLGEEERNALRDRDPGAVLSDVADLPGDWVLWTQVADPLDCAATDRVYALDEESGAIRFGDGRHGAIPPIGVNSIVAFAYRRTEPAIGGEVPGNAVPARAELNLVISGRERRMGCSLPTGPPAASGRNPRRVCSSSRPPGSVTAAVPSRRATSRIWPAKAPRRLCRRAARSGAAVSSCCS